MGYEMRNISLAATKLEEVAPSRQETVSRDLLKDLLDILVSVSILLPYMYAVGYLTAQISIPARWDDNRF